MVGLFRFNNGDKVRTSIAGFEGIINGRADYLHGCARYLIMPVVNDDGDLRNVEWFDEGDIILIEAGFLKGDTPLEFPVAKGKGIVNV